MPNLKTYEFCSAEGSVTSVEVFSVSESRSFALNGENVVSRIEQTGPVPAGSQL